MVGVGLGELQAWEHEYVVANTKDQWRYLWIQNTFGICNIRLLLIEETGEKN